MYSSVLRDELRQPNDWLVAKTSGVDEKRVKAVPRLEQAVMENQSLTLRRSSRKASTGPRTGGAAAAADRLAVWSRREAEGAEPAACGCRAANEWTTGAGDVARKDEPLTDDEKDAGSKRALDPGPCDALVVS
jgi:hypothetical protein